MSDANAAKTTETLTPADVGFLAATLDDCLSEGLGDDDTVERLQRTARCEGFAVAACYPWFRATLAR